jgi:wyosine [tRNA(Phe)-imidazoG37] synthetase (radical SAM superfamily)
MGDAREQLRAGFRLHPRDWRSNRYAYCVISRRSKGLSVGINLNPDKTCNFRCIYCQVDRGTPGRVGGVDLAVLEAELRGLLGGYDSLFAEPEFRNLPASYRRFNDIAFSGDGEPTASPVFPQAARLTAALKDEYGLPDVKIVVITNACFLSDRSMAETLAFLDEHNGEIWAKLDAGTEEYFRLVNVPSHSLQHVLDNILAAGRIRPMVIQSLFIRVHDELPPPLEIEAYLDHLRWLLDNGGQIKLVQVYTMARRPTQPYVSALTADELEHIAARIRPLGVPVECYP